LQGLTFLENVKAYVGFDQRSSAALREAYPFVAPHFQAIIDDFYVAIEAHPGARSAITGGPAQIERLKRTLVRWIEELFTGPHDQDYFERRARIGRIHVRINLPQVYMFTAMDRIRLGAVEALRAAPGLEPGAGGRILTALHQILDIELAIMLETYREDLLVKNRAAERLATIGQFAAGIGHELRNPLGVLASSAFLMEQRLVQLDIADPKLSQHLRKIQVEVERSNKTISDLLELARSRPLQRRAVEARHFLDEAVSLAHLPAEVEVRIDAPAGVTLSADPDQLTRVVTNLVINASQAMNARGRVTIEARRGDAETSLYVRDDGPGVPLPMRELIFEALFTTKAKGNGLGLALCRRIVEAHGGTIAAEPTARGATFKISIPDAPASPS
jgi:two-component system sensor histidine kinase HydH